MKRRTFPTGRVAIVVLALLAWRVRLPAEWVESIYSRGLYMRLQPVVTSVSNQVPFALFDVLLAIFVAVIGAIWVRSLRESIRRRTVAPVARLVLNLAVAGAVVYLAFVAMWGFNYQREPLVSRLAFDETAARPDSLRRLGAEAVRQLNTLHKRAHDQGFAEWERLPRTMGLAYRSTHQYLVPGSRPVAGVPKRSLLTYYFQRAGVSGMTDPFALEVLVDRGLLPFERPFVAAHEWAHLAGYGNEAEANYLAWITCLQAGPQSAYSGWLYLYSEIAGAVGPRERDALWQAVADGPRTDLQAIAARARLIEPALQSLSWRVYDRYLKANRVEAGVESYSQALRLVLGTRLTDGLKPVLRSR